MSYLDPIRLTSGLGCKILFSNNFDSLKKHTKVGLSPVGSIFFHIIFLFFYFFN